MTFSLWSCVATASSSPPPTVAIPTRRNSYLRARRLAIAGGATAAAGVAIAFSSIFVGFGVGGIGPIFGAPTEEMQREIDRGWRIAAIVAGVGAAAFVVGIPMMSVGLARRARILREARLQAGMDAERWWVGVRMVF